MRICYLFDCYIWWYCWVLWFEIVVSDLVFAWLVVAIIDVVLVVVFWLCIGLFVLLFSCLV